MHRYRWGWQGRLFCRRSSGLVERMAQPRSQRHARLVSPGIIATGIGKTEGVLFTISTMMAEPTTSGLMKMAQQQPTSTAGGDRRDSHPTG
jgi:hypothetical protein